MKIYFQIMFILISSILFMGNGCSQRVYQNILKYDSPAPLVYDVKIDSNKINSFVSFDFGTMKGQYEGEKADLLRIGYTSSTTKKHFVFNQQISFYGGRYFVNGLGPRTGTNYTDKNYDGNKYALGLNGSIKAGVNFNFSGFRLGLGFEPMVISEFGEFTSFRIDASDEGIIKNDDGYFNFLLTFFPYVSYEFDENKILGIQINVGYPGGFSPILSYQTGSQIFWIGYLPDNIRVNIGYMIDFNKIKSIF